MFTASLAHCFANDRVVLRLALAGLGAAAIACSKASSIPTGKARSDNGVPRAEVVSEAGAPRVVATGAVESADSAAGAQPVMQEAASSGGGDASTASVPDGVMSEAGVAVNDVDSGTVAAALDAGASPVASVDVSGDWAMFAFEDPVAVSLTQQGEDISGTGCCGGLPTEHTFIDCCSSLAGSIVGRRVNFAFAVELAPGTYAVDAFVSSDGTRMAGAFHNLGGWGDEPTAWLRLGPGQAWLSARGDDELIVPDALTGTFLLTLDSEASVGTYAPAQSYRLQLMAGAEAMVRGALGAFWHSELAWNEAEQTLTAGPVPETDPALPTELDLRFEEEALVSVKALLPSGEVARFSVSGP